MNNQQMNQTSQANEPQSKPFEPQPKPFDPNSPPEGWVTPQYYQAKVGQVKVKPKPWYKSKTLWFNGIVTAMGFATTASPMFEPYMTPDTFGLLTAGVAFGNAVLRFVTHKPIQGGMGNK
ncbi:MAG: hypothetical protein CR991_11845 [Proteobacteria bacterium]|nr:MAG: hypothetical protein CR991_11845 [Pseudomonadota bacterium]